MIDTNLYGQINTNAPVELQNALSPRTIMAKRLQNEQAQSQLEQFAQARKERDFYAQNAGTTDTNILAQRAVQMGLPQIARQMAADAQKQQVAALDMQIKLKQLQPKYGTAVQYDGQRQGFVLDDQGNVKKLEGVTKAEDESKMSALGLLIKERDAKYPNPNDPGRRIYDQAINKYSTHAPNPTAAQVPIQLIQTEQGYATLPTRAAPGQAITMQPLMSGGQQVRPAAKAGDNKAANETAAKAADAQDVLRLLDQAAPLIEKSTGSYVGTGRDTAARAIGLSTGGAQAAAQLRAIEGLLVSKMPRMSGPQSDKDVLLYKQMAGQIGDSTIPPETKQAAMAAIRTINERYAKKQPAPSNGAVKFLGFE